MQERIEKIRRHFVRAAKGGLVAEAHHDGIPINFRGTRRLMCRDRDACGCRRRSGLAHLKSLRHDLRSKADEVAPRRSALWFKLAVVDDTLHRSAWPRMSADKVLRRTVSPWGDTVRRISSGYDSTASTGHARAMRAWGRRGLDNFHHEEDAHRIRNPLGLHLRPRRHQGHGTRQRGFRTAGTAC